ncbi:MAG: hypothetical protein SH821_13180, partial [Phototrophicales bacterium]|nr:hypothetical protein [Phototrophicales bacterium]
GVCHGKPPATNRKNRACHGKPLRHTHFCDENRQNNPIHGVSEGQTGGSPPVGRQHTRYFYHILSF